MVRSLGIMWVQLPGTLPEPLDKTLFKRFRYPGLYRQHPGVVGRKATAFHRILGGHHQPLQGTGGQVFRAEMVMIRKWHFVHVCTQATKRVEESPGVADTAHRPNRLAFRLSRGTVSPEFRFTRADGTSSMAWMSGWSTPAKLSRVSPASGNPAPLRMTKSTLPRRSTGSRNGPTGIIAPLPIPRRASNTASSISLGSR